MSNPTLTQRVDALTAAVDGLTMLVERVLVVREQRESAPAAADTSAPKARTFATKAERKAGKGFPCTAENPCSRVDLRTAAGASSHEQSTEHGWHTAR